MDDGNYSSLQHVLGNIGGKIAHARNIMQDIDLSKVHTLGLTFSDRDREKMPRYTLPNMKVESIGLSRYGGEDISFQEDLDRRRTDVSTPGNECARNLANILDHVAESYRA